MEMCSESGYGVVDGVGGCTEYLRDGIRPHIKYLEAVKDQLEAQLKGANYEVHQLRNINKALMLNHASASNLMS